MKIRAIAASLLAVFLLTGAAYGQGRTGTIQVIAEAQDGSRLPGVVVTAASEDTLGDRTSVTDAYGVATLPGLAPATNYTVTATLDGFNGARNENVLVRSGQTTSLTVTLSLSAVEEELIVTAESPIVDTTSAITGQDITLELTESLPTGRSYQSYLQLVPGVMPTDPTIAEENPASRSGLNYRDIGGDLGVSRDNYYYIEGINVTDPVQGTFGANLNTEIIQEQQVITGGIPAEYVGSPGLISNVVTKSGGNQFSGSANYYFQNDSLVESNENAPDDKFDTFDAAITFGGPIVQDRLWFFGSFRQVQRDVDVISLDTSEFLRSVSDESDQGFFKLSASLTPSDTLTGTFLDDPRTENGTADRNVQNNRDEIQDSGGNRYTVNYSHVFGSFFLDLSAGEHKGEASRFSVDDSPRNDIVFRGQAPTQAAAQLGGSGLSLVDERDNTFYKADLSWFLNSAKAGDHTLKGGFEFQEHKSFRDRRTPGDSTYTSLSSTLGSVTAGDITTGFTDLAFDVTNTSDFGGFVSAVNASANRAALYTLLDTNRNGVLEAAEVGAALVFNSTVGNPNGQINYDRTLQSADGPQDLGSEGTAFYVQDTMQFNRLSATIGLRSERYEHFATTGEKIFTFDYEVAPRVSVVYDLSGDGRQKVTAYYGRYYDPVRNNMTQFAGTLTGAVREEQVFVGGEWLTYRTRGGPQVQDALFAPTTKTPYTDDFQIGYARDLGRSMSVEANLIKRETRDILEDYDLAVYAFGTDGTTDYPGPIDDPNSLFLGFDYFGYTANPGSNFVIATLEGGVRDWEGLELIFRKRYSNNWQALASYTYADAHGNTNSDSNADFQGDDLVLDPRAPNMFGVQPGLIRNLFKAAGSYQWNNGITVGGTYRWNSGTKSSLTELRSRRNLPIRGQAGDITFAGINDQRFVQGGTVGALTNPSWGQLDSRVQYNHDFGRFDGEVFLDIFNVLDEQSTIRQQDLQLGAGDGSSNFGDGLQFVAPRRYFVGVRLGF